MRESTRAFPNLGKELMGVEIGVWRGDNALSILQNTSTDMLYLVDPYIKYDEYNHNEISSHPDMDANEEHAKEILEPYKDRITWIKKTAHDASKVLYSSDLDFVYIDGNHKGEFVKQDIEDWYHKIRKGGMLAGHDFHYFWIREVVMEHYKNNSNDLLYSWPFKDAGAIHDWDGEWKLGGIPNKDISVDDLDWWLVKSG